MRILLVLVLVLVVGAAVAVEGVPGPEIPQPAVPVVTVATAAVAPDDSWVALEATVVERLEAEERYRLRDRSGSIEAEIPHELAAEIGLDVGQRVRLRGVIDSQLQRRWIEVATLRRVVADDQPAAEEPFTPLLDDLGG